MAVLWTSFGRVGMNPQTRVLAIDPGDVWIGLAISDETRRLSRALTVLKHESRAQDAQTIVRLAEENGVGLIVIGITYDDEGEPTPQGRKSLRLGEAIRAVKEIDLRYWDESFTTNEAVALPRPRRSPKSRQAHRDEIAARILLDDFLEHGLGNNGATP